MKRKRDRMDEILYYGGDILASPGMRAERGFLQHGSVSVYEHSLAVTSACLLAADAVGRLRALRIDRRALVRGALLHDYFLYDWHEPGHAWHGFRHAEAALSCARRDFSLGRTERDMIRRHMFPLNLRAPRTKEGVILCVADKLCAARETAAGIAEKLGKL